MGITGFSVTLLEKAIEENKPKSVIELGAQNLYNQPVLPAPYANKYYEPKGIKYTCIDKNGENGAIDIDLSKATTKKLKADLVTDFGTSEHVEKDGKHNKASYYSCWKQKHNMLNVGGVMVNENPKTGNWKGHGFNYLDVKFYTDLAKAQGYEIIEVGEHPAMHNTKDGWNIYCVLKKVEAKPFMSLTEFKKLKVYAK